MKACVAEALENVSKAANADSLGMGEPHSRLLDAIRKFTRVVETPAERLMRLRLEPVRNASMRMVLETGAFNVMCEKQGKSVSAQELSESTGYDALFIARILRPAIFEGICDQTGETAYAANETTRLFITPGIAGGEKHHWDNFMPVMANLVRYMHDTGIHQFPKDGEDSPFTYTWKASLWEFFEQHPEHKKWFSDYMAVRYEGVAPWFTTFPMADILARDTKRDPDSVLLVDVGGSSGHELAKFHRRHPDVPGRLIVQDLPTVIEKHRTEQTPRFLEMMPYDFFTPQPVEGKKPSQQDSFKPETYMTGGVGARAYFFQNIAHDWPDAECRSIFTNTARAMSKDYSRMLIKDYVLPDTGVGLRASTLDIVMMCACSGIERTKRQWLELLDACGLEIVKVWQTRSDYEQVIEAKLKS